MRLVTTGSCAIFFLLCCGSAGADPVPERPTLALTAHQDHGLSIKDSWTAELKGSVLTLVRPGKKHQVRQLRFPELEELRRAVEGARFGSMPPRLGFTGVCDDCSRCRLAIDTGGGPHQVERRADAARELVTTAADDRRFRDVWDRVKRLARVENVPDACW